MRELDAFITKPLFRSKVAHTFHQFCQSGRSDAVAIPIEEVHTSLEGKRICWWRTIRLTGKSRPNY